MQFRLLFRNLLKNKRYTAINLTGMAVGMACCFLILAYLRYEHNFDTFFPNLDRLYRVHYHAKFAGSDFELSRIPAPIGPRLAEHFPQVEAAARLYPRGLSVREPRSGGQFELENALFADSTVQQVLRFEFLQGDPATALRRPYSTVLSDETARRIFGNENPLGRTLRFANEADFTVTGVVRALPHQSHLEFDLLAPFGNLLDVEPVFARPSVRVVLENNWLASYASTYVLLKKGSAVSEANALFPGFLKQFGNPNFIDKQAFSLFPVRDIHLKSTATGEVDATTNPTHLRMFGIIGFLILLIAGINFINLSTAVYLGRMKEVAVRKTLGAGQGSLIRQLLGETLLLSFAAFLLALLLLQFFIPAFNAQTGKHVAFHLLLDWPLTLTFMGIFVLTGLLAGLYPAVFASRFRPVEVFQKNSPTGSGGGGQWLRKTLITAQFGVGIALLAGALIMQTQLRFWQRMPLGFDGQSVLALPLSSANMNALFSPGDSTLRSRQNAFDERAMQIPGVSQVTLCSSLPGFSAARHPITTEKVRVEDNVFFPSLSVDYDFAETFRLQLVAGRDFDKAAGTDHISGFMLNELAVKTLGWKTPEEAIGQRVSRGGKEGTVVGVVKNFQTAGLQIALDPLIMEVSPGTFTTFAVRLNHADVSTALPALEKTWAQFFPEKAFDYSFMEDDLQDNYLQESRMAGLCGDFAGLAIFLSCFGLFGLVSFSVRQRAKEISIRKVLGATAASVVGHFSKGFLKLVLIAFVPAVPVAWWAMDRWLADFAFRVEIGWEIFALSGVAALLVAFLTVGSQALLAALAHPSKALRND